MWKVDVDQDGGIWWWSAEVSDILCGSNIRRTIGRLKDDEKRLAIRASRKTNQINMSGLLRLIYSSKSDGVDDFRKWITNDVIKFSLSVEPNVIVKEKESVTSLSVKPKVIVKRRVGRPKGRVSLEKEKDQLKGEFRRDDTSCTREYSDESEYSLSDKNSKRRSQKIERDRELMRLPEERPFSLESGRDHSEKKLIQ